MVNIAFCPLYSSFAAMSSMMIQSSVLMMFVIHGVRMMLMCYIHPGELTHTLTHVPPPVCVHSYTNFCLILDAIKSVSLTIHLIISSQALFRSSLRPPIDNQKEWGGMASSVSPSIVRRIVTSNGRRAVAVIHTGLGGYLPSSSSPW